MADQVLQAVHALYQVPDPHVKEQANAWLEAWQQSPEAWTVSDSLLNRRDAPLEARYLCAQTLRTKISRDFDELPAQSVGSLRESLLRLLLEERTGVTAIRTQLCLALAALATHVAALEWAPNGVVEWVEAHLLSGANPAWALAVELIGMLAGEGCSFQLSLRPERRRSFKEELQASLPRALGLLSAAINRPGCDRGDVLDAFGTWLRFAGGVGSGVTVQTLTPAGLLIDAALSSLQADGDDEVLYKATDVVVELVYVSSSFGRPRNDLAPLASRIVAAVMALRPRFHVCCAAARQEAEVNPAREALEEESEEAKALARLFAEVGEAYVELIASGRPDVLAPVEALLDVAGHPSDSIACISFNFWHRLSTALTAPTQPEPMRVAAALDAADAPLAPGEGAARVALFSPAFERLVLLLRGRVRFPDSFDEWRADEQADFKRARAGIGEALTDAAAVLGGQQTLNLLSEPLRELAARSQTMNGVVSFDWRAAEAALYCIRAVHRFAPPPGDALLMALFASLPSLPSSAAPLAYTAALTVGAYSDWLAASVEQAPTAVPLDSLLRLLVSGLGNADAASACALSLRRLCEGARSALKPEMPRLLALFRAVQGAGDVATYGRSGGFRSSTTTALLPDTNLYEGTLDEEDVQQVIEGVVAVCNSLGPIDQAQCLQEVLETLVEPIQAVFKAASDAANTTTVPQDAAIASARRFLEAQLPHVLALFDRVSTVFETSTSADNVGQALEQLWPVLETALDQCADDARAVERLCRVPRYGLRTAKKAALRALPTLLSSLPARFERTQHPVFLYVISEAVKSFGDDPSCAAALRPVFAELVTIACRRLRTLHDVSARPDLADDTFLLAGRALSYCPSLVLHEPVLSTLLDVGIVGALVQHREACCSILAFLARLLDPSLCMRVSPEEAATLRAAVAARGPALVRAIFAGVAGALPPSRLTELADVTAALVSLTGTAGTAWLHEALAALPPQSAEPSDRQRVADAAAAIASCGGAAGEPERRTLHRALVDLSDVCRRNRRAQRAAESALVAQTQ